MTPFLPRGCVMRFLSFLLLVVVLVAVGYFAWQNTIPVTVDFWQWHWTTQLAALIGIVYVLGMFSGWFVVGMLRRSIHRITER